MQQMRHRDDERAEGTPALPSSSPPVRVSPWSSLSFGWFGPVLESIEAQLDRGRRPDLGAGDARVPPLPPADAALDVNRRFAATWTAARAAAPVDPALATALARAFGPPMLRALVLSFVVAVTGLVGPGVLRRLTPYLQEPTASLGEGLALTAGLFLANVLISVCSRHSSYICMRVGLRAKTALTAAVFHKALRIDASYYQDHPVGQVTNLMSVDVGKVAALSEYVILLFTAPVTIVANVVYLWRILGPSCLGGVAVLVVSGPLSTAVTTLGKPYIKRLATARDARIDCNQEMLAHMDVLKMATWEGHFRERTRGFRQTEVARLYATKLVWALVFVVINAVPMLVTLFTFALYVTVAGRVLDAGTALAAIALFDGLKAPVVQIPLVLSFGLDAAVSLQRIRDFLLAPDYVPPPRLCAGGEGDEGAGRAVIALDDASFSYQRRAQDEDKHDPAVPGLDGTEEELLLTKAAPSEADERVDNLEGQPATHYGSSDVRAGEPTEGDGAAQAFPLRDVNLRCNEGEFVAVVGGVGSGKSTLLKALLGEVQHVAGSARVRGDVAYFAQTPFIMNDTIKGNILFGRAGDEVDEGLYRVAVRAACLEPDFRLFPDGDGTEIGEKGANLSGGQKARVAIGRVVYRNADISLLDDCLSAVDAHVGRELFNKCIIGELLKEGRGGTRKKTVILATNALQYLSHPRVDRILVMKEGVVVESGSYSDLMNRENSHFKASLDAFQESNVRESEGNTNEEEEDLFNEEDLFDEEDPFDDVEALDAGIDEMFADEVLNEGSRRSSLLSAGTSMARTVSVRKGSRRSSVAVRTSMARTASLRKSIKPGAKIMTDEAAGGRVGQVDTELYMTWVKAAGGAWVAVPILAALAAPIVTDFAAKKWVTTANSADTLRFLGILALVYLAQLLLGVSREIVPLHFALKASKKFFSSLLSSLLLVPLSFYNTTPSGRILSRFSNDVRTVDEALITSLTGLIGCILGLCMSLGVLLKASAIMVAPLPFLGLFYKRQYERYNAGNRELKRMNSTAASPVYNLFSEALNGYCTIRAFDAGPGLFKRITASIDKQQHVAYLMRAGGWWLGLRLDFVGTCLLTLGCLSFILGKHITQETSENHAILAGLAVSYLLTVPSLLLSLILSLSGLEASMVAVERIQEYTELEKEAAHHTPADNLLQKDWPSKGLVEFKNVNMRYRPGTPLRLKGFSVNIPSNAKVGICGRTGAGKSTIVQALMRLVELDSGQILLDGVDIKTIGLAKLRSSIAIVPQEPIIFSGTVQTNIDPLNQHSNDELIDALRSVGLYIPNSNSSPIKSVEDKVDQSGSNFSSGQRQLLVIARALLEDASVVFCDEATASIDGESDARIQKVFRSAFADSTTLTVAHRLNTIMDSTHILVIADGKAMEFDTPSALLSRGGLFKDLVDTWDEQHA